MAFAPRLSVLAALAIALPAAAQNDPFNRSPNPGVVFTSAFTLIDGEGFEAPDYTLGNLTGQLAATNDGSTSAAWVQVPLTTPSSATVQNAVAFSGSQAVRIDRGANSDARWAAELTPAVTPAFIGISWNMRVDAPATSQPFGPFFGIEAYDASSGIARLAAFGVDATTGEILYTLRDDGVLPGFLVADTTTVNLGEWNTFQIILDYGNSNAILRLNGNTLLTTPFEQDGTAFTDADLTAIAASFDAASQAATGTAYFDNYFVVEGDTFENVVPEPTSLAILALGGVTLAFRRSRQPA